LGVFAPFIAGEGRIVPYDPLTPLPAAQYVPPLGYSTERDSGASQSTSGEEKTVSALFIDFSMPFVNGISQGILTYYEHLSQIDSIVSTADQSELWAESEGSYNYTSGNITLTDTSFNGTALIDYRTGGKIAVRVQVSYTDISEIKFRMKIDTTTSESRWPVELFTHVFEDGANFETDEPLDSASVKGHSILSGEAGTIYPGLVEFKFGYHNLKVNEGDYYWLVLDTQILSFESFTVTQRLFISAAAESFDLLHLNAKTWNAGEDWESEDIFSGEGWLPTVLVYHSTTNFHVLGTDSLGRDILSATIHGARTSLFVAFVAISLQVFIGLLLGSIAGYYGGKVDGIIMRITDIFLSIPNIFLILIAITIWENISLVFIGVTLGLFNWSGTARIVRAEFLSLREMEYTDAARVLGVSDRNIIFKHLLPNALAPVIVTATLGVATVILIEAGLSFLGFGDPSAVSWGTAIQWGMTGSTLRFAPWVATIPGIAIFIAVLGFNLMGDALRDALDPRLR
jgi:peptide/nickel transport system permease protein